MNILVTGGLGYIGSHLVEKISKIFNDCQIYILDNLSNSDITRLEQIKALTTKEIFFFKIDLRSVNDLENFFLNRKIDYVFHLAGKKSISESFKKKDDYYKNNVEGTRNLLNVMKKNNVKNLIFSSSASVYGTPKYLPLKESHILCPNNPYSKNKLECENLISSFSADIKAIILRYFNPVGYHVSGKLYEDINKPSDNLMHNLIKVAIKKKPSLSIFGNDYQTEDGTCERDFIHIDDLVLAHIKCIEFIESMNLNSKKIIFNIGTGSSISVYKLINKFKLSNNVSINYSFTNRREGDVAISLADPSLANNLLGWYAKKTIECMCSDSLRPYFSLLKNN